MKRRTLGYSLIFCFAATLHAQSIDENPMAVGPGFTISGTTVNVVDGADTGNVSTITVTPTNGFTGSVTLTAAVTAAPANAILPPTFSFGATSPVVITGMSAKNASMAITTTPFYWPCPVVNSKTSFAAGGAALACILFFGIPARRRSWRKLALLALLAAFSSGILACGGSSIKIRPCPEFVRGGTTPGAYTITITGTSGDTTATGTMTLNVTQNEPTGA